MTENEKELISLDKGLNLSSRLALLLTMLEKVREKLLKKIEGLTMEELDYTPDETTVESIGTLLLHIAGVEWGWIFGDIDGQEVEYERWKQAFALSLDIPQINRMELNYYMDILKDTRESIMSRLGKMKDSDLDTIISSEDRLVTIEWILFHLIEHEAMHLGQISVLKRLSKNESHD
jgi:uncharacterized damage-inducible protein DinB